MGRRRKKGRPINGWVCVDKPAGVTSTQVVGTVRHAFDARKAGHAGTLDPLATGILAIALGEATKTVPYAVDSLKIYRFTVTLYSSKSEMTMTKPTIRTNYHRFQPKWEITPK